MALIFDSKQREIKNHIVYVGLLDCEDTQNFKDHHKGYPKNGCYMTVNDLVYFNDPIINDPVLSHSRYHRDIVGLNIEDFLQVNSKYLGMQFIDRGEDMNPRWVYIFFITDLDFFTHIKLYHASYNIIRKLLTKNGFWSVPIISNPISGKFIALFKRDDARMIVSVKTDTYLYNTISIIYPKDRKWEVSGKTTLIFNPPSDIDTNLKVKDIPLEYLLQESPQDIDMFWKPGSEKQSIDILKDFDFSDL